MKITTHWFARCKGIAKTGPFLTQETAVQAVMGINGLPAPEAFTWPERVPPTKRAGSRSRKAA